MRQTTRIVALVFPLVFVIGWGEFGRAQIIFNGIDPGKISTGSIDPKPLRRDPIETQAKPSKPYEPMPHFHNRNILPDRIEMGTLSQPDIPRDHIRPDRITWNLITRENIAPQRLSAKPLMPAMSPGERMTAAPLLAAPRWSFDQQLRGEPKPTTRFDSSIYSPQPNYDRNRPSPVLAERQEQEAEFRPAHATHPINWWARQCGPAALGWGDRRPHRHRRGWPHNTIIPALASDHRADILRGLPGGPRGVAGAFSRSIIIAGECPREAIRVVNNLSLCGAD